MVDVEGTFVEDRNEVGKTRKKRKRDVDVEAASTEVVASHAEGRNDDGESRKKRKKVKDGSSVDSIPREDGNKVRSGDNSLNEIETEKSDSSNERKKKKKRKNSSLHEEPPLLEAMNEKLGDEGVVIGDDKAGGRKGRLEKSGVEGIETENSEQVIDRKREKKKKKRSMDEEPVLQEVPVIHAWDSVDETVTENSEDPNERKKEKKKKKLRIEQEAVSHGAPVGDNEANTKEVDKATTKNSESSEDRKKEKKKKKRRVEQEPVLQEAPFGEKEASTKEVGNAITQNSEYSEGTKKKKKKKKKKEKKQKKNKSIDQEQPATTKSGRSEGKRVENDASDSSPTKSTSKRVSFSEDVQVFPISNDDESTGQDEELVRGKRFSPEEDELVKAAVLEYITSHALGDEGLKMVLNCRKHKEIKNCWKEIGLALPWRPYQSVYYRAHIIFERDGNRKWSTEERELVLKFHEKHGSDWKTLAEAIGKHRIHVKDAFRRLKVTNLKSGKWSQDEYQTLFDLVNADLRMKAFEEERKSKHGMLKDNISWEAISEKLDTRIQAHCCSKWYHQLTSPLVTADLWRDVDDYRMVMELYNLDACCMEDVDWDNLLEHRSGELCRRRWNQMVKHLGDTSDKSFADQVDILSKRYCFDVLEAKEAYYSKPLVD